MTPEQLKAQQDVQAAPQRGAAPQVAFMHANSPPEQFGVATAVRETLKATPKVDETDAKVVAARANVEADRARGHAQADAEAEKQRAYTEAAVTAAKATQAASAVAAQARLEADKIAAAKQLDADVAQAKAAQAATAAAAHAKVEQVARDSHGVIDGGHLPPAPPMRAGPPEPPPEKPKAVEVDSERNAAHDAVVQKSADDQRNTAPPMDTHVNTSDDHDPRFGNAGKGDDKKPDTDDKPKPVTPPALKPPPVVSCVLPPPTPYKLPPAQPAFTYTDKAASSSSKLIAIIVGVLAAAAFAALVYFQYAK